MYVQPMLIQSIWGVGNVIKLCLLLSIYIIQMSFSFGLDMYDSKSMERYMFGL
jgi:hypothetical protein